MTPTPIQTAQIRSLACACSPILSKDLAALLTRHPAGYPG